jgi:dUTP pyrophosphatase
MDNKKVDIKIKLSTSAKSLGLPFYATDGSAGLDLKADISESVIINPTDRVIIPTGISLELPSGYEAQIRSRSGLAIKNGVVVLNSPGTIDSDYRGEIKVILINHSKDSFEIKKGDKIAQMVISKHEVANLIEVVEINNTSRGAGGFGSTGV